LLIAAEQWKKGKSFFLFSEHVFPHTPDHVAIFFSNKSILITAAQVDLSLQKKLNLDRCWFVFRIAEVYLLSENK